MFFPKLRRRAKWVFVLLAAAFGLSFLVAGVGTGFGSGIGDYLTDIMGREPTGGALSVDEARERVEASPEDAGAHLELARAHQAEGNTDQAIAALERYRELQPDDADALQQLATLYNVKALEARERVARAQLEAQEAMFLQELQPGSDLVRELTQAPVLEAVQTRTTEQTSSALQEMRTAFENEAAVYQELTALRPEEPSLFLRLGQAQEFAGDYEGAVLAYERFVELAPDDSSVPLVEQRAEELREQIGAVGTAD